MSSQGKFSSQPATGTDGFIGLTSAVAHAWPAYYGLPMIAIGQFPPPSMIGAGRNANGAAKAMAAIRRDSVRLGLRPAPRCPRSRPGDTIEATPFPLAALNPQAARRSDRKNIRSPLPAALRSDDGVVFYCRSESPRLNLPPTNQLNLDDPISISRRYGSVQLFPMSLSASSTAQSGLSATTGPASRRC